MQLKICAARLLNNAENVQNVLMPVSDWLQSPFYIADTAANRFKI